MCGSVTSHHTSITHMIYFGQPERFCRMQLKNLQSKASKPFTFALLSMGKMLFGPFLGFFLLQYLKRCHILHGAHSHTLQLPLCGLIGRSCVAEQRRNTSYLRIKTALISEKQQKQHFDPSSHNMPPKRCHFVPCRAFRVFWKRT